MAEIIERHVTAGPDVDEKLAKSKAAAESLKIRTIKCPKCGFYLLDVYGHDHYLIRVKCRKCKFNDTIDTALFRTIRLKNNKPILLINVIRRSISAVKMSG